MNQLPQESVERICSYLHKDDLKAVLTLSTEFRFAAERYSGAFEKCTVRGSNVDAFRALYCGHRMLYLREVIFRPSLPDKTDKLRDSCREDAAELLEKDMAFTQQIKLLLVTLKTVAEVAARSYSPGGYRLTVHGPTSSVDFNRVCDHHLYVSWRVHLLNPDQLPQVSLVRSFEYRNSEQIYNDGEGCQPRVDLRCIVDLMTKFPDLEYLDVRTGGYEWHPTMAEEEPAQHYERDWEGPRRNSRHDFAVAITSHVRQLPIDLKRASLDFMYPLDRTTQIHHGKCLPDLVNPSLCQDPFSTSLRIMATNLRELRIRAMVDDSLFGSGDATGSFGPNLEIFEVTFHLAHPKGRWYFQGPGGEGHDAIGYEVTDASYPPFETSELDLEMDALREERPCGCSTYANLQFRVVPNNDNLRPFLAGFACAAKSMPRLKEAMLWSPLSWEILEDYDDEFADHGIDGSELLWGVAYTEPGRSSNKGPSRQFEWMVGEWRPDTQLRNLFHEIGREEHGDDLTELWTEDVYDSLFPDRDWADDFMFSGDPGRIPLRW
jgi:hypothetical protein